MKVFLDNREKVLSHNARFANGEVTFELGMNKFGDLLSTEFAAMYNGYTRKLRTGTETVFMAPENFVAPISVDWRTEGAVTPVKDQKQCGSCWAFSATGSLEGQNFRKTGSLVSLSEQNLVDCSSRYGNAGCNGGLITEASYPYEARTKTCRFNAATVGATCTGYVDIKQGSESDLMAAIASVGPVSVAIDASRSSFQLYRSGKTGFYSRGLNRLTILIRLHVRCLR